MALQESFPSHGTPQALLASYPAPLFALHFRGDSHHLIAINGFATNHTIWHCFTHSLDILTCTNVLVLHKVHLKQPMEKCNQSHNLTLFRTFSSNTHTPQVLVLHKVHLSNKQWRSATNHITWHYFTRPLEILTFIDTSVLRNAHISKQAHWAEEPTVPTYLMGTTMSLTRTMVGAPNLWKRAVDPNKKEFFLCNAPPLLQVLLLRHEQLQHCIYTTPTKQKPKALNPKPWFFIPSSLHFLWLQELLQKLRNLLLDMWGQWRIIDFHH